jgi:hypothetical protein
MVSENEENLNIDLNEEIYSNEAVKDGNDKETSNATEFVEATQYEENSPQGSSQRQSSSKKQSTPQRIQHSMQFLYQSWDQEIQQKIDDSGFQLVTYKGIKKKIIRK